MQATHEPLTKNERKQLAAALRGNGQSGTPLTMDRATGFLVGWDGATEADKEVIDQIASVPVHY